MNILHITDFHFINNQKALRKQSQIVDALINKLKSKPVIDFVFFTGDLVFSGSKPSDFLAAQNALLDRIKDELKIPVDRIFICPGNHDINREEILLANKSYMRDKIKNNDDINSFIKRKKDFESSLKTSENYYQFAKKFYTNDLQKNDIINPLYSVHNRVHDHLNLKIITLNSSWSSFDEEDRSKLLFPIEILEEALVNSNKKDIKILLMHHPITDFKSFNKFVLEDMIYDEFDFVFSGDIHRRSDSVYFNQRGGIIKISSPATLTHKGDGKIGFSLVDFKFEDNIVLEVSYYDNEEKVFYTLEPITIDCPQNEEKRNQNKLRKRIRELFTKELEDANDLLIENYERDQKHDFLEIFSPPVLKLKDQIEIVFNESPEINFNFHEFYNLKKNYRIYGGDKFGKTSILKRIQLELLNNLFIYNTIPLYVDCDKYELNEFPEIYSLLKDYLVHFSSSDLDSILKQYKIILLLDNFDFTSEILMKKVRDFLNLHQKSFYILTSTLNLYRRIKNAVIRSENYLNIFIHEITKSEIRTLSNKWLLLEEEAIENIVNNIAKAFKQFNLPFTYWIVSTFLAIYKKTKHFTFNNNAELIEYHVEKLLDKEGLALSKERKFTFENYRDYLSDLAFFLYDKHKNNVHRAPEVEVRSFTEEYLNSNPRYVAESDYVLNYIFEKRILKKYEDGRISFRLNGDFEYFLAIYISKNEKFRKIIIDDDKLYLSFRNELDIYSGINKKDEEFLRTVFEKTKNIFQLINNKYKSNGKIDNTLNLLIKEHFDIIDILPSIGESQPISFEEQDKMLIANYNPTNSEVVLKEEINVTEKNFQILEKHLFILSRIFRNIDDIKDTNLIIEVFDFILESYCNLGYKLIEEITEIDDVKEFANVESAMEDDITLIKRLIDFTISFTPILMQISLYESVGHENLENIIKTKIDILRKDAENNQYYIFLLCLLLVDINIKKNHNYVDYLIDLLDNKVLQSCTALKIMFYFVFKSYKNKNLEEYFREKFKQQQIRINPDMNSWKGKRKIETELNKKKVNQLLAN